MQHHLQADWLFLSIAASSGAEGSY